MADTLLNSSGGSDNGGYETAPEPQVENTTLAIADPQPADIQIDFGLQSQELFVFRWTLRFLSLWCPASACLAEKTFYPALVNILLLLMIASDFNVMAKGAWKSIDIYVFLAIDAGMYLSHLFGVVYFRSRDLEENMLNVSLNIRCMNAFKTKLTRLKLGIIFSYLFLVVLVLLFFNTEVWLHGRFQCNSSFKFLEGFVNHFVCFLNYPTNIYGVGNSLALAWTMCLLQQTCFVRLQQLSQNYLKWTGSTEEAIYDYLMNYSRKVKTSCLHLEKWFVTHNIILIIATPFLCIDLLKGFKEIGKNNAVHTGLFVGFLVYTIVIWVAPLYFAEQLQIHDDDLRTKVNEFCPGTFREFEPDLYAQLQNTVNPNQTCYIFHSRTEVNKFLSYLNNRKSGFLMGSYSFQFKLSMFSVFLAMISFATRVIY